MPWSLCAEDPPVQHDPDRPMQPWRVRGYCTVCARPVGPKEHCTIRENKYGWLEYTHIGCEKGGS